VTSSDQSLTGSKTIDEAAHQYDYKSCFFQLRRLKQVCRTLGPEITASLDSTFVTCRLAGQAAYMYNSPFTTGTERCGQTDHWNWTSRSHHSSSPVSSLASGVIQNYIKTLCAQAPCSYWMQSSVSHLIGHCNIRAAISSWPMFSKQSTI